LWMSTDGNAPSGIAGRVKQEENHGRGRMKTLMSGCLVLGAVMAFAGNIVVHRVNGDVSIRHGVTEVWMRVAAGDVLRPDDTMRTGKKGSAVVTAETEHAGRKTMTLPAEVIVDMSDIRELSRDELMLNLTMEKVRSSSYEWKNEELHIPNAAVVHGANAAPPGLKEADIATGMQQLNGARVLFDNGFFATCALRGLEVFRRFPALGADFRQRMMVAEALERTSLKGEALSEYGTISAFPDLTPAQHARVKNKIEALRK